ncbi:hypothetical protein EPI10_015715 [Gossypium australe]|uniref:Uncharacterized protein n=1 Tax=Gossypium australe TaxID=47621 RepID=A0A5B6VLD0_9ROSI|nr:hypothetical protein EPI10_015715 [Gossypium australe]
MFDICDKQELIVNETFASLKLLMDYTTPQETIFLLLRKLFDWEKTSYNAIIVRKLDLENAYENLSGALLEKFLSSSSSQIVGLILFYSVFQPHQFQYFLMFLNLTSSF